MPSPTSFDSSFDPTGAVRFDLKTGSASDFQGARLLLVPTSALAQLGAPALAQLGSHVGRACGSHVAKRLGGSEGVRSHDLEVVVSHLAGELAVAGLGAVQIEQWGRALVAVVTNPGLADHGFIGTALAEALSVASGRTVTAAALGTEGGQSRYFLGSAATSRRAQSLVASGKTYAEVIGILQQGATS